MSSETIKILNQIRKGVYNFDPVAEVILFGSRARGDHRPDSDWDILIVTEKDVNKAYEYGLLKVFVGLQIALEIDINYIIRRTVDWNKPTAVPLYNAIKQEGIRL